ncbi:exodeoxyribonuclease VII small subunit [Akkermansiaceae bacterium]|nr:exodeoxyribonuclease VII small subunit [Akkermansiaceae bacterium]
MPARKKNDVPAATGPSFEEAMGELEDIVEAMEGEQLPLEELVARYEEGSALLKHCGSVLSAAKARIELITLADRGEQGTDDGGSSAGIPGNSPDGISGDPDESNDISLF